MNIDTVEKDISELMDNPERNQRYSFCHQLTRLTRLRGALKHDDRLEALSIAVDYYTESMDRDEKQAHHDHTVKMMQEEVQKHLKAVGKWKDPADGFLKRAVDRQPRKAVISRR